MRARRPGLLALPLSALLAACAATVEGGAPATTPLAGTQWRLVTLLEEDVATVEPGALPHIAFEPEERAGGSGGCNRFTGSYAQAGDRLRLGPFAVTRRACAESVMHLENRFLRVLAEVERCTVADGALELVGADGQRLARFVAMPAD